MVRIKQATSKGYIEMCDGGVFDATYPNSKTRRGRVQGGGQIAPTITAQNSEVYRVEVVIDDMYKNRDTRFYTDYSPSIRSERSGLKTMDKKYRIRKLTPTECYRLMGVSDEDSKKMLEVNSNSQCYKQAGNSIVVDVMCAMFSQLGFPGVKKWNESR